MRRSAINFFSKEKPSGANGSHGLMPPAAPLPKIFLLPRSSANGHSLMTNIGAKENI